MKLLLILALLVAIKAYPQSNVYGKWKVVKYMPGDITEIDNIEAAQYIGKEINLSDYQSVILSDTCKNVIYSIREAKANEYLFYNYRTYAKTLGILNETIKVLELSCQKKRKIPDYDFIFIEPSQMIFSEKGYFFFLARYEK